MQITPSRKSSSTAPHRTAAPPITLTLLTLIITPTTTQLITTAQIWVQWATWMRRVPPILWPPSSQRWRWAPTALWLLQAAAAVALFFAITILLTLRAALSAASQSPTVWLATQVQLRWKEEGRESLDGESPFSSIRCGASFLRQTSAPHWRTAHRLACTTQNTVQNSLSSETKLTRYLFPSSSPFNLP